MAPLDQQTSERPVIESPELFVRDGGICYNHIKPDGTTKDRHEVAGWKTYDELLALGASPDSISYCPNYSDAPAVVIVRH